MEEEPQQRYTDPVGTAPLEVLVEIFFSLPLADYQNYSCVSSAWRAIVSRDWFHKELTFRNCYKAHSLSREVMEEEFLAWSNTAEHSRPVWGFLIFKATRALEKLYWDEVTLSDTMTLSSNGKVATHSATAGHGCVYSTVGWKTGIHRWRTKISSFFWVALGVAVERRPTFKNNSGGLFVGYTAPGGIYKIEGDSTTQVSWPTGSIIELTLDCDKRILTFAVEGQKMLQMPPLAVLPDVVLYPWADVFNANGTVTLM